MSLYLTYLYSKVLTASIHSCALHGNMMSHVMSDEISCLETKENFCGLYLAPSRYNIRYICAYVLGRYMQSSITCRKVFVISLSYKNILSIYRMRMKIRRWARRQMEGHTTRAFKGSWFQVTIYLMWLCEVMAMGKVSQRYSSVNSTSSLYKLFVTTQIGRRRGMTLPCAAPDPGATGSSAG